MQLFLMRHGITADLGEGIADDASRPLTEEGRTKTAQVAAGLLRCEIEPDLIATSPLLRARQTAEIVLSTCKAASPKLEVWPELEHAEFAGLVARLEKVGASSILLVGHEPGLSRFASQLLTGSPLGMSVEFKKAAVCALELEMSRGEVDATLLWHATPRQLRLMG